MCVHDVAYLRFTSQVPANDQGAGFFEGKLQNYVKVVQKKETVYSTKNNYAVAGLIRSCVPGNSPELQQASPLESYAQCIFPIQRLRKSLVNFSTPFTAPFASSHYCVRFQTQKTNVEYL